MLESCVQCLIYSIILRAIDRHRYNRNVAISSDTHPKIEELQMEQLRQTEPWRKLELVAQLNKSVRQLTLRGLEQRFPNDSEENLQRRLAALLYGPELAEKAYGPLDSNS